MGAAANEGVIGKADRLHGLRLGPTDEGRETALKWTDLAVGRRAPFRKDQEDGPARDDIDELAEVPHGVRRPLRPDGLESRSIELGPGMCPPQEVGVLSSQSLAREPRLRQANGARTMPQGFEVLGRQRVRELELREPAENLLEPDHRRTPDRKERQTAQVSVDSHREEKTPEPEREPGRKTREKPLREHVFPCRKAHAPRPICYEPTRPEVDRRADERHVRLAAVRADEQGARLEIEALPPERANAEGRA